MIIPTIWKNKKCSKPPTRFECGLVIIGIKPSFWVFCWGRPTCREDRHVCFPQQNVPCLPWCTWSKVLTLRPTWSDIWKYPDHKSQKCKTCVNYKINMSHNEDLPVDYMYFLYHGGHSHAETASWTWHWRWHSSAHPRCWAGRWPGMSYRQKIF